MTALMIPLVALLLKALLAGGNGVVFDSPAPVAVEQKFTFDESMDIGQFQGPVLDPTGLGPNDMQSINEDASHAAVGKTR